MRERVMLPKCWKYKCCAYVRLVSTEFIYKRQNTEKQGSMTESDWKQWFERTLYIYYFQAVSSSFRYKYLIINISMASLFIVCWDLYFAGKYSTTFYSIYPRMSQPHDWMSVDIFRTIIYTYKNKWKNLWQIELCRRHFKHEFLSFALLFEFLFKRIDGFSFLAIVWFGTTSSADYIL